MILGSRKSAYMLVTIFIRIPLRCERLSFALTNWVLNIPLRMSRTFRRGHQPFLGRCALCLEPGTVECLAGDSDDRERPRKSVSKGVFTGGPVCSG